MAHLLSTLSPHSGESGNPHNTSTPGSNASRGSIRLQFDAETIILDPPDAHRSRTLRRIGCHDVPQDIVKVLAADLTGEKLEKERTALTGFVKSATTTKNRENEEQNERGMYAPMMDMISHILRTFDQADNRPRHDKQYRNFHCGTTEVLLKATVNGQVLSGKPDMRNTPGDQDSARWEGLDCWGEIKAHSKQHPFTLSADKRSLTSNFGTQVADYARCHLSVRPFQRFSVGLLIFGHNFCVANFDREGVTFSPVLDIWGAAETFVRVIIALCRFASPEQLGIETGITQVPDEMAVQGLPESAIGLPRYIVPPIGSDARRWLIYGAPLWSSLSGLGRGTSTWNVQAIVSEDPCIILDGRARILKNYWRNSGRLSEPEIYSIIYQALGTGGSAGVADCLLGGDVQDVENGVVVSVRSLRASGLSDDANSDVFSDNRREDGVPTATLHRLILDTVGRSIWRYQSLSELLCGFRDVVRVHDRLQEKGILHRDISAGNVLLSADVASQASGFLVDFELARISDEVLSNSTHVDPPQHALFPRTQQAMNQQFTAYYPRASGHVPQLQAQPTHRTWPNEPKRGLPMTGTTQFMAIDILTANQKKDTIPHAAHHDVESMVYVLAYAILRRNIEHPATPPVVKSRLQTIYDKAFGHTSLGKVLDSRKSINEDHPVAWVSFQFNAIMKREEQFAQGAMQIDEEQEVMDDWLLSEAIGQPIIRLFGELANSWGSPHDAIKAVPKRSTRSEFAMLERQREHRKQNPDRREEDQRPKFLTIPPLISHDQFLALLNEAILDLQPPTPPAMYRD